MNDDIWVTTVDSGQPVSLAELAPTTNVTIDDICALGAKFEEWSSTLNFYLPGLNAKLATVPDVAGNQEPGQVFLNGDPAHPVCGQVMGFNQLSAQLASGWQPGLDLPDAPESAVPSR